MVHQPTGCPRFPPRLVASNLVATTTVNRKMSSKVDEIWKDRCVKICVDIVLDVCMKKARFNLQSRSLCFSLPFSLLLFEASELMSKPGLTLAQMPEESMFGLDNGQGLGRFSKFPLGFLLYFLNLGYHEGRLLRNLEFLPSISWVFRNMLHTFQVRTRRKIHGLGQAPRQLLLQRALMKCLAHTNPPAQLP